MYAVALCNGFVAVDKCSNTILYRCVRVGNKEDGESVWQVNRISYFSLKIKKKSVVRISKYCSHYATTYDSTDYERIQNCFAFLYPDPKYTLIPS